MKKVLFALVALCAFATSVVHAVDLQVSAMPVKARVLQSYNGSGFYWGVHTFAETEKLTPVANDTALGGNFAVGAAVGVTAGYLWGGNGTSWQAVEAMASYKNISPGSTSMVEGAPFVVDSKWSFTQRVKFGGPVEVMLAMLPNLGTVFPGLPAPPVGGVGTTHPYLFGALHEDDISQSIGLNVGRAWRIKGGFGVGMMQALGKAANNPNGALVVADVWAEYIPPSSSVTVGIPDGTIKTNQGRETRIGLSILY